VGGKLGETGTESCFDERLNTHTNKHAHTQIHTGCAHCADMYVDEVGDNSEIVRTRKIIAESIDLWLGYKGN
jgi:hypothetical protein